MVIVHISANYSKSSIRYFPALYLFDGKRNIKLLIFTAKMLASRQKLPTAASQE
jgi:hypothetical protein